MVNSKVSFEHAWGFILKVGVAAHGYGSTATRLESFLKDLSKKLGYQGVFRSTPSDILFALREGPKMPQRVEFIATPAPNTPLFAPSPVCDRESRILIQVLSTLKGECK